MQEPPVTVQQHLSAAARTLPPTHTYLSSALQLYLIHDALGAASHTNQPVKRQPAAQRSFPRHAATVNVCLAQPGRSPWRQRAQQSSQSSCLQRLRIVRLQERQQAPDSRRWRRAWHGGMAQPAPPRQQQRRRDGRDLGGAGDAGLGCTQVGCTQVAVSSLPQRFSCGSGQKALRLKRLLAHWLTTLQASTTTCGRTRLVSVVPSHISVPCHQTRRLLVVQAMRTWRS